MQYIGGSGPSNARIAIVYDFPKAINPAMDALLEECFKYAGSTIKDCYITYLVKYPIAHYGQMERVGAKWQACMDNLFAELDILRPNVVLCFSNTVLKLLTGEKDIANMRGSILHSSNGKYKVIPLIHPGSILQSKEDKDTDEEGQMLGWKSLAYIKWDILRAVKQSQFNEFRPPLRDLQVAKTSLDFWRFRERYADKRYCAVDIETFRTIPVCISFAFNSKVAISVPLIHFPDFNTTRSDLVQIWKDVADLLYDNSIMKIFQNGKFDQGQLSLCYNDTLKFGLAVRSFFFDTFLGFKLLYPELPGSLAFQCSVLTEEPYYKEEGKGYNPKKDKADRLLLYNAKDSVCTFECYERISEELKAKNLEETFYERIMPLHPFYYAMERKGLLRDEQKTASLRYSTEVEITSLNDELQNLILSFGFEDRKEFNVNSPKQSKELIYEKLKIPKREKADEKTLDQLMRNVVKDEKKKRILELIIRIRKLRKLIGTYLAALPHPDGRIKTSYKLMLETGRTATSIYKSPVTTIKMGMALQTITKDYGDDSKVGASLRSIFIPNDGYVFIEPDLSQAEARVVALLANDKPLLKIFQYNVDIHRITGGWMFGSISSEFLSSFLAAETTQEADDEAAKLNKALKELVNAEQRQTGKKFRHSGHYDMGKHEAAIQAQCSEKLAQLMIDKFHSTNPNIREVFHKGVVNHLNLNDRELTTPYGRKRTFFNKWGNGLFKEAYAYLPQSTVSDALKFSMIRVAKRLPELDIRIECHDSFLGEIRISDLTDKVLRTITEEMQQPINFDKCSLGEGDLIIPCDIKIGENWNDLIDEKKWRAKK